jgi:hypothetical protein
VPFLPWRVLEDVGHFHLLLQDLFVVAVPGGADDVLRFEALEVEEGVDCLDPRSKRSLRPTGWVFDSPRAKRMGPNGMTPLGVASAGSGVAAGAADPPMTTLPDWAGVPLMARSTFKVPGRAPFGNVMENQKWPRRGGVRPLKISASEDFCSSSC